MKSVIQWRDRLVILTKVIGLVLLAVFCATHEVSFNPLWVLVYIGIVLIVGIASSIVESLVLKIWPAKPHDRFAKLTAEEGRFVEVWDIRSRRYLRRPWHILLIAGEDGFFFLPLVYVGITVPAAIVASVLFAAIHYGSKPWRALPGQAFYSLVYVLIVLPHGILALVAGHLVIDVFALTMIPVLRKKLEEKAKREQAPNQPPLRMPVSGTPAADAPVAPPPGIAGR